MPILVGEYFRQWKDEMLVIFDEFQLRKYVEYPYAPPIDPIHPSHDDEVNMLGNLNTVNLIIRGLPRNVLNQLQNFECAHTLCNNLQKIYPNYSLKILISLSTNALLFTK